MSPDIIQNIILSAAVAVAVWHIFHQRALARMEATLHFLLEYNDAQDVGDAIELLKQSKDNLNWHNELSEEGKHAIKFLLNKFEILAIGLEKGIYDRAMIENAFGSDLIKYYHYAEPFINGLKAEEKLGNTAKDMPFEHFEKLAKNLQRS